MVNLMTDVCHISFRLALSRNLNRLTRTKPIPLEQNRGGGGGEGEGRISERDMERYQNFEQKIDFDHEILL